MIKICKSTCHCLTYVVKSKAPPSRQKKSTTRPITMSNSETKSTNSLPAKEETRLMHQQRRKKSAKQKTSSRTTSKNYPKYQTQPTSPTTSPSIKISSTTHAPPSSPSSTTCPTDFTAIANHSSHQSSPTNCYRTSEIPHRLECNRLIRLSTSCCRSILGQLRECSSLSKTEKREQVFGCTTEANGLSFCRGDNVITGIYF